MIKIIINDLFFILSRFINFIDIFMYYNVFYLFNIYFFYTINSNIKQYHNIYILKVLTQ